MAYEGSILPLVAFDAEGFGIVLQFTRASALIKSEKKKHISFDNLRAYDAAVQGALQLAESCLCPGAEAKTPRAGCQYAHQMEAQNHLAVEGGKDERSIAQCSQIQLTPYSSLREPSKSEVKSCVRAQEYNKKELLHLK